MNDHLIQLRVVRIQPETAEVTSYFLEPVDEQAVQYQAGQFLTLIVEHRDGGPRDGGLHGHEVRRSYSLSSMPEEPLRLTIKRVQNGEISRYLHDTLHVGDILTSLQPAGRFTLEENQIGDVVLLGAGSGITPLFALLKQTLLTNSTRRVTLIYSSTNEQTIIFRVELDELHHQFTSRFQLLYLLSDPIDGWQGLRGRLNNVMLERYYPS